MEGVAVSPRIVKMEVIDFPTMMTPGQGMEQVLSDQHVEEFHVQAVGDLQEESFCSTVIQGEGSLGDTRQDEPEDHSQNDSVVGGAAESVWYQCKHCSILIEDVMTFLFHIRQHDEISIGQEIAPYDLQRELNMSSVSVFLPHCTLIRFSSEDIHRLKSTPMPRLTRAPTIPIPTLDLSPPPLSPSESHEGDTSTHQLDSETLPRKCKLCIPTPYFSTRMEFVDHLFQCHRVGNEFRCSKPGCRYKTRAVQFIENHIENHPEPYSRFYTCHLCQPKTNWFQSTKYARHMEEHLDADGRLSCPHCIYGTRKLQLFNKHMKKRHPQIVASGILRPRPPLRTPSYTTVMPITSLDNGKIQIKERRVFYCYVCTKSWYSRKMYESHMILRHRNARGDYSCEECQYQCSNIRLISRHFKYKHTGNIPPKNFVNLNAEGELPMTIGSADGHALGSLENGNEDPKEEDIYDEEDEVSEMYEEEELEENGIKEMYDEDEDDGLPDTFGEENHGEEVPEIYEVERVEDPLLIEMDTNEIILTNGIITEEQEEEVVTNVRMAERKTVHPSLPQVFPIGSSGLTTPLTESKTHGRVGSRPIGVKANTLECVLCSGLLSFSTPLLYFDHVFQQHCRDNGVDCPECNFRATSLETVVHHVRAAHAQTAKPNYVCRVCNTTWTEVQRYSAHMRTHMGSDGYYACTRCPQKYPTLNRFNEHIKRTHELPMGSPKNRHQKIVSPVQIPATNNNSKHVTPLSSGPTRLIIPPTVLDMVITKPILVTPPKTIATALVNQPRLPTFKSSLLYMRRNDILHVKRNGGGKKSYFCYYCDPNGIGYVSVKLYSKHMRSMHMRRDGLYACPTCPSFPACSLKRMNEHMKRKAHQDAQMHMKVKEIETIDSITVPETSDGPILAELLGKMIKNEKPRPRGEKWFQCKACFILVESQDKFIQHQRTHHPQSSTTPPHNRMVHYATRRSSTEVFSTPVPMLSFEKPGRSDAGYKTHVGMEMEMNNQDVILPGTPKVSSSLPKISPKLQMPFYKCKLCTPFAWFRSQFKLVEHIKENHCTDEKFQCTKCPFIADSNILIQEHMNTHSGITCSNLYSTNPISSLNTLEEKTEPISADSKIRRSMICVFCSMVYTNQRQYIAHMNSEHTNDDGNFSCPKCPYFSTSLLSRATKHIRRHGNKIGTTNSAKRRKSPVRKKRRARLTKRGNRGKRISIHLQPLICRACSPPTEWPNRIDYMGHAKVAHGNVIDGTYICPKCPEIICKSISDMNRHMKLIHNVL